MDPASIDLSRFPLHLGLGATANLLDEFDGTMEWYQRYEDRTRSDGIDGRLLTWHTFDESWTSWEMHPNGHEVVICVAGSVTLHQEIDGAVATTTIGVGRAAVNPPGVWHTADVESSASVIFITPGMGTEHRPR